MGFYSLIVLWHRTVIDWLANQTSDWISVMSSLIFSAIGSVLCVDGKCYRPFDRRLLPPMRSPGTSIDTSPNWLCTCLIDRVKHQPIGWLPASPNKRLRDWLVSQNLSIANAQSGRTATDRLTEQSEYRSPDWLKPYPINRPPNHLTAQLRDYPVDWLKSWLVSTSTNQSIACVSDWMSGQAVEYSVEWAVKRLDIGIINPIPSSL